MRQCTLSNNEAHRYREWQCWMKSMSLLWPSFGTWLVKFAWNSPQEEWGPGDCRLCECLQGHWVPEFLVSFSFCPTNEQTKAMPRRLPLFLLFSLSFLLTSLLHGTVGQGNKDAKYAGSTQQITWTMPFLTLNVPPSCSLRSSLGFAAIFDYNVTVSGMFHVSVMSEYTSGIQLFAYNDPFNSSSPCENILPKVFRNQLDGTGGPLIADFVYLSTGRYWFAVTSSTGGARLFALQISPAMGIGFISSSSSRWRFPSINSAGTCSFSQTLGPHFSIFSWTQRGSGQFDLLAGYFNSSSTLLYSNLALYHGTLNATLIQINSCSNIWYSIDNPNDGLTLWNLTLENGQNYTAVFSGEEDDDFGHWGLWITPTRTISLISSPIWVQPTRDEIECRPSNLDNSASWYSISFVAEGQVVFVDLKSLPSSQGFSPVDSYSWLFGGDQTIISPPPTCGGNIFAYEDTGDISSMDGIVFPNRTYTIIVSTYSGENEVGQLGLYLMYGTPIGEIPPPPSDDSPNCDGNAFTGCNEAYSVCRTLSETEEDTCECFLNYGHCASCTGCYTEGETASLIQSCITSGCASCEEFSVCSSGDGEDGGRDCDFEQLDRCFDDYQSCIRGANGLEDLCECMISFGQCAACLGECLVAEDFETLKRGCERSNCEGCERLPMCRDEEEEDDGKGSAGVIGAAVAGATILFLAIAATTAGIVYFVSKRKHVKLQEDKELHSHSQNEEK